MTGAIATPNAETNTVRLIRSDPSMMAKNRSSLIMSLLI